MASILSHPAVPLAIGVVIGRSQLPPRYWALGAVASIVPDVDVLSFVVGIPYEAPFGHRGATHSIVFALGLAAGLTLWKRRQVRDRRLLFAYLFVATLSHALLDMLTDGGLGVALFWPISDVRLFFPATPITVSPIGTSFFSSGAVAVLFSEACWIWLPCIALALATLISRRHNPTA